METAANGIIIGAFPRLESVFLASCFSISRISVGVFSVSKSNAFARLRLTNESDIGRVPSANSVSLPVSDVTFWLLARFSL